MDKNTSEQLQKAKRGKKGPISFKIKLTEEQSIAKEKCYDNQITFLTGKPGTAKTTVACNVALDLLIKGGVSKILLTRPTVAASKDMGFLPGDAFDFTQGKMAPYIAPILSTMYKLKSKEEIDLMVSRGQIEIVPIQFVRGLNFEDCVVLVDEAQNLNVDELKALTTRICKDAKMIFTSDVNQIDLYDKDRSAGHFVKRLSDLEGVCVVELLENFRSPLALSIMDMLDAETKARAEKA